MNFIEPTLIFNPAILFWAFQILGGDLITQE